MRLSILAALVFVSVAGICQQPQTSDVNNTQLLDLRNVKYVDGVGPGYWPTCNTSPCSSLVLHLAPGTCFDSTGVRHAYAGGTLTLTGSATNYVTLSASACTVQFNTSGYGSDFPVATIVAGSSTITTITDDRTFTRSSSGGTFVNGSSVSSPNFNDTTPAAASNTLNVTWQVSGSSVSAQVAAATNSTLGLIKSATCSSNNWISSITTGTGAIGCSQPAFSNLSGSIALGQTPLTTLGDILFVDSTPALARLAGQTTAIKKYLSQTGTGSISAVPAWAQVAFADLSGSAACAQLPTFTGDVTNSLCALTLGNIPSGTTMAGSILATNISAPSTPASGKTSIYVDSTKKMLAAKNDAGSIGYTVIDDAGSSNTFITSIVGGVISKAQPSFSNLSGSAACSQMPALTGDTTSSAGSCAASTVKVNGASVPASATALASNSSNQIIAATYQGNGSKVQLGTGSASTNHCLMYDSNGNAVDSGIACSTGGGGGGIVPAAVSTYHWWPPSSANAMDDEFTGSTFNAGSFWTGVNTGSCTFTQNNDSWLAFTCPSNGSAESMRMQCQSLPSAPYTFATYTLPDVVGGSFLYNSTLILRESSTGKLIDVGSDQSNTTVSVVYWSSSTVDVARLASISSGWQPVPWYLTAGRSGTTLTWTLALGGLPLGSGTLTKTYSESLTAHFTTAPDQVCIGLSPYNVGVTSYFDFFRRTL